MDTPFVLNSSFAPLGEILEKNIAYNRQQETFKQRQQLEQQQQQATHQRQNQSHNLSFLNAVTDASKFKLGMADKQQVVNDELSKLQQEILSGDVSADPAQFEFAVKQKMGDFIKWHTQLSGDYDTAMERVKGILKDNPNLKEDEAKQLVFYKLSNKYFDSNGSDWQRKHPDKVNVNDDPVEVLAKPEVQGMLAKSFEPLKRAIQGSKLRKEDEGFYTKDKKGKVDAVNYDIGVSDFAELQRDKDGNITKRIKTDTPIALKGGVELKPVTEETFNSLMQDGQVASAFEGMWQKNGAKIKAAFGGYVDPHTENILKRDFMRQQIEENDLSFVNPKEKHVEPPAPKIKISVSGGGGGSRGGGGYQLNDVFGEIKSLAETKNGGLPLNELSGTAQGIVLKYARDLTGRDDLNQSNVYIGKRGDGTLSIMRIKGDQHIELAPLDYKDVNMKANQPLGAKAKQQVIKNAPTSTKKKSKKDDPLGIL